MKRLLSTIVFGGAFIWVAVIFFDVPREIVWVFFVLTVWIVLGLIAIGFVGGVVLRFWHARRSTTRWFEQTDVEFEPPTSSARGEKTDPPSSRQ
jgi:type VI protein secretion system component VasK